MSVDVAAIRAALSKATPGEWEVTGPSKEAWGIYGLDRLAAVTPLKTDPNGSNADLIVLLRNSAESLLEEVAEAERRGAVKALRNQASRVHMIREHGLQPDEMAAPYAESIEQWLNDSASHIENGADL